MKRKLYSFSLPFIRRIIFFIVISIVLISSTIGQNDDVPLPEGVANPGEIPEFSNFDAPGIIPGNTGKIRFTMRNRYTFNKVYKDNNMTNVSLIVNIYRFVTLEQSKGISKISNGPKIVAGNGALQKIYDRYTAEFYWQKIQRNESVRVELSIKSSSNSPQGTYFVRMHLKFTFKTFNNTYNNTFNNTYFEMKSRGYFTNQQWENAQPNATEPDGYPIVGRLNLDKLGVDGIIPDTSFRIKEPIPMWPFYIVVGLAIFFLIMAGVFYFMDEKGKFPATKQKLDELGEKVKEFRYKRR